MKRAIFTLVVFCLLAVYATAAGLVASRDSTKYHQPSCKVAQKIKQENLVTFASVEEAVKAGYEPCKRCSLAEKKDH